MVFIHKLLIPLIILVFSIAPSIATAQTLDGQGNTFGITGMSDSTFNTVNYALNIINTNMDQVFAVKHITSPDDIEHGFLIIGLDTDIGSFDRNGLTAGPFLGENPITHWERQEICSINTNMIGAIGGASCSVGALIGAAAAGVATAEVGGVGGLVIIAACSAAGYHSSEYAEYGQEEMASCSTLDDGTYDSNGDPQ